MVARENPVSTWYGAILFRSGEGSLLHTRATFSESFEAVFLSGWRSPTPSHKSHFMNFISRLLDEKLVTFHFISFHLYLETVQFISFHFIGW
jgi:hypothetical protein